MQHSLSFDELIISLKSLLSSSKSEREFPRKKKFESVSCLYVHITTWKKFITFNQWSFTARITNQPLREWRCRKITTKRAKTTFSQHQIGSIYDFSCPLKCLCATIAGKYNDVFFSTTQHKKEKKNSFHKAKESSRHDFKLTRC